MTVKTYTFTAAGSTNFYQWMPRITIKSPGRRVVCIPTEATYRRFVRLANSGQYQLTIAEEESIAWTLTRKPQLAFDFADDWKKYDTQDHEAAAAYYDGLLTGK